MQALKTIIVDDELLARDLLARWLSELPTIKLLAAAKSLNQAIKLVQQNKPELIFLDINLAGENGFALFDEMPSDYSPSVVFVTAYTEYAVKAFRINAVDYLHKPFNKKHLHEAIERAWKQQQARLAMQQQMGSQQSPEVLRVKQANEIELVDVNGIQWIASAGGYSVVHTINDRYVMRESLSHLERKLGDRFVRVHRSTVVNLDYVAAIQPLLHGDAILRLKNDTEVRLSRRYRGALKNLPDQ